MRFKPERWIPKGATKVCDKRSDAVAYLYTDPAGRPCARVFFGKQSKPVLYCYFRDDARRARAVADYFGRRRSWQDARRKWRDERAAYVNDYKVGEILNTCWGYDQTNREFFEVVGVKGKWVELRELAQVRERTTFDQGICAPQPGEYVGPIIRRLAQAHSVKIDDVRRASRSTTVSVAGVKVVTPQHWSDGH